MTGSSQDDGRKHRVALHSIRSYPMIFYDSILYGRTALRCNREENWDMYYSFSQDTWKQPGAGTVENRLEIGAAYSYSIYLVLDYSERESPSDADKVDKGPQMLDSRSQEYNLISRVQLEVSIYLAPSSPSTVLRAASRPRLPTFTLDGSPWRRWDYKTTRKDIHSICSRGQHPP